MFRSMTKCRIRRRAVTEHWPKANGKRCIVPNSNEMTAGSNKNQDSENKNRDSEPGFPVLVTTSSQFTGIWHEITAYGHHLPSPLSRMPPYIQQALRDLNYPIACHASFDSRSYPFYFFRKVTG